MNGLGAAALGIAWFLGILIVLTLWAEDDSGRAALSFILPLGAIVGLGVTSVIYFVASSVSTRPAIMGGAAEVLLATGLIWRRSRKSRVISLRPLATKAPMSWLDWALATLAVQMTVVAAVMAWRTFRAEPFGGWDGWAIWNMHARFMLRAGPAWTGLLSAPQLNWTHPDYPRLVPASVARIWAWAGTETPLAPALVAMLFAAATVALLVAILVRVRGRYAALLSGLLLLSTPFFLTFASNEHADIPLASFMLGAVGAMVLAESESDFGRRWTLAGICAGLAAWTKNEGLLFAFVLLAICFVREWRRGHKRTLAYLAGGLALGVLPVCVFKFFLAPTNDLLAVPLGPRLMQLGDLARHRLILASLWRDLGRFGEWQIMPYAVMFLPLLAWRWHRPLSGAEAIIPVVLIGVLTGFYGVYLLSPQDLAWHIDTSLVRLLLQLWPLVLLWWGLAIPSPPAVEMRAAGRRLTGRIFVIANVLVAIAIVSALAGQLAADELAAKHHRNGDVSVTLGDGWFGLERHGHDRWAWSRGDAALQVQVDSTRPSTPVALRFAIRSLAERTVAIRLGDRVLWQQRIGANFVPVEIPAFALPAGTTSLAFTTDAPGVAESTAADARALVFAVYNLEVR